MSNVIDLNVIKTKAAHVAIQQALKERSKALIDNQEYFIKCLNEQRENDKQIILIELEKCY